MARPEHAAGRVDTGSDGHPERCRGSTRQTGKPNVALHMLQVAHTVPCWPLTMLPLDLVPALHACCLHHGSIGHLPVRETY